MQQPLPTNITLRTKTYQILEGNISKNLISKIINLSLILLIMGNVLAVIFESEVDFHQVYHQEFILFELISLSIFCFEYVLRVWCCVESSAYQNITNFKARINYIISPMALIDLISILPFLIALFFTIDLRVLRLIRVLRLLKLTHYFKGFNIFIVVITKELKSITAAMMVMWFLIIIAASLMHSIEGNIQPEVFGSILQSMWWSVVTMTTVGYGDVVPVTVLGKVVSTFIMLVGVGLVALPAGMLAARFGEELRERKKSLDTQIKGALSSGFIDKKEYQSLEEFADKLEIDPEGLKRSIALLKQGHHSLKCPHCGK